MMNFAKVEAYRRVCEMERLRTKTKIPLKFSTKDRLLSASSYIVQWLEENVGAEAAPRKPRQRQLYIQGPTNSGKTFLKDSLFAAGLRVYLLPCDGHWFDGYADGAYDLIMCDEFDGGACKLATLLQLLEGTTMCLPRRNLPPSTKAENLPMILFSNNTPEECFPEVAKKSAARMDALIDRLEVVTVSEGERIDVLVEQVNSITVE